MAGFPFGELELQNRAFQDAFEPVYRTPAGVFCKSLNFLGFRWNCFEAISPASSIFSAQFMPPKRPFSNTKNRLTFQGVKGLIVR